MNATAMSAASWLPVLVLATAPMTTVSAQSSAGRLDPEFVNATVEDRASTGSLARDVAAAGAAHADSWVVYRVATTNGPRSSCSGDWNRSGRIALEPAAAINVMMRLEAGRMTRIRTATPDCVVDAGGLPVVRLTGVATAESARWLLGVINDTAPEQGRDRTVDPAVAALSWHQGPEALKSLIDVAKSSPRSKTRGTALFWLAQRAEREAGDVIQARVDDDPDTAIKKKAVFALSQLPPDRGIPMLIDVARSNSNREVRRQAMFWLGQSRDPRAIAFFEEVLQVR